MNEVEVKFLDIDPKAMVSRILAIGAKEEFNGELNTTYFDTPSKSLKKKNTLLRLRTKGDQVVLTLKIRLPVADVKSCDERELFVGDAAKMQAVLDGLGFIVVSQDAKFRRSFHNGSRTYELEKREGIPWYLEVEAQSRNDLLAAIKELGLDFKDAKPWTGKDVIQFYKKK